MRDEIYFWLLLKPDFSSVDIFTPWIIKTIFGGEFVFEKKENYFFWLLEPKPQLREKW